jgi:alginate O-acetyltransferase complex protein AlgI
MLFHEYAFLFVFLPLNLLIYSLLPKTLRNTWLFIANCTFYASSSWFFLPLLLFTIGLDYVVGARVAVIEDEPKRRGWLLVSLITNLLTLGYFKYAGFITRSLRAIPGLEAVPILDAPLPAGISFYVFQSMSYTIDLYRRRVKRARSFRDFGAFVTLYPHLIAGPIVRYEKIETQLVSREHSADKFARGVYLFVLGLAKKLLVADTLASLADPIFKSTTPSGFLGAWTSILLYAGQIYFDFSGYSDMAIGLGRMVGFELPINFDSPYKADSFSDFWRRWHITLSSWLRDYLYIPLGGNRLGKGRTYFNLFITMFLGGLWHGASWSFAIWGMLHGAYLAIERALGDESPLLRWPRSVRRLFVFGFVTIAWVFFRIEELPKAIAWLSAMFTGRYGLGTLHAPEALALGAMFFLIWVPRNTNEMKPSFAPVEVALATGCFALSLWVGYGRGISPFLYFRF